MCISRHHAAGGLIPLQVRCGGSIWCPCDECDELPQLPPCAHIALRLRTSLVRGTSSGPRVTRATPPAAPGTPRAPSSVQVDGQPRGADGDVRARGGRRARVPAFVGDARQGTPSAAHPPLSPQATSARPHERLPRTAGPRADASVDDGVAELDVRRAAARRHRGETRDSNQLLSSPALALCSRPLHASPRLVSLLRQARLRPNSTASGVSAGWGQRGGSAARRSPSPDPMEGGAAHRAIDPRGGGVGRRLWYAMLCYAVLCCAVLCYAMLCYGSALVRREHG